MSSRSHSSLAKPKPASPRWVAGLIALYFLSLLASLAHDSLLEGEGSHCGCEGNDMASLAADCGAGGPCSDPEHHHKKRRPHDHGQCPTCQGKLTAKATAPGAIVRPEVERPLVQVDFPERVRRGRRALLAHPVRGPPAG